MLISILHFAAYLGLSLVLLVAFQFIYVRITPQDEWKLIKEEKNTAAAIGFGGAIIGFAIALSGAVSHSVSLLDACVWGLLALGAQSLAFCLVRFLFVPRIADRIKDGELSAGVILAAISIAVGLLNAASMTY
jgi:putative membrane protein